ncbi:hypothetical protein [uncultured Nostoc sp.]|uniref:hypothetical protein n=1 Tax=uncultured Nostoc sp. TaxID=340711 RepID=UPI0035C9EA24
MVADVGLRVLEAWPLKFVFDYVLIRDEWQMWLQRKVKGAIAQLILEPTKTPELSVTYIHSHNNLKTGTGSELTSDPFNDEADAIIANSFSAEAAWQLSPVITLVGRVGFIHAKAEDLPADPIASIFT